MISYKNRQVASLLALCMFGLVLTGCWDMRSANEYIIVSSMAVTAGDQANYHVYLQMINPLEFTSDRAKGNSPTLSIGAEGNTMDQAFSQIERKTARKLELSHMMLLIMDDKLLETDKGILFFEFLESMKDIRNDIQLVAAHRVAASEFTKLYFPENKVSTVKIRMGLDSAEMNWGGSPNTNLKQFITAITSEGRQPVMSSMTIEHPSEQQHAVDAGKNTDSPTEMISDGIAVMRRAKLVGHLNTEETRDVLWTQDQIKNTSLTVQCGEGEYIQVRVGRSKTHLDVDYEGNRPKIRVRIDVEGTVSENQCKRIMLSKISGFDQVRKLTEKEIQGHVEATIAKVQKKYGVDIFGFGEELMRSHYQAFKKVKLKWDDEFVKAEVTVEAKAEIRRDGMTSENFLQDIPS
ncbi:Ger(x)C family spore germination protein [Paenibacillus sp. HN-1]|uniref:Ger(x)C family spore germination protein n=1 Tax=Paenibacillus TaxID=44249 RepID=UPI001CA7B988|nr:MULTISPECIES: Ger(x)C family spore germination protein [Paenibacillus]MBY9078570.1 Ger(x)C family spore germination protein [Paenibacillus sp. CGMCC 1.18879]MBY9083215.1 Ger(x)C family spore germination protein [Paenibacillus sinensis]